MDMKIILQRDYYTRKRQCVFCCQGQDGSKRLGTRK